MTEPISRALRGAAHTLDLATALDRGGSVFRLAERAFVVAIPGRGVWLLAARLPFRAWGGVAVRGNPGPSHPYLPSPAAG